MKMLTPREVAEVLQVSYEAALSFIHYSGIAYTKVGNRYRVAEEHLRSFLLRQGHKDVPLQ